MRGAFACLPILIVASLQAQTYPDKDWVKADHGLPPQIEKRVNAFEDALDTTGIIVVRHGKVVYQRGDLEYLSYLASSRKSILSMLYGNYVDNGTIDLKKTIGDLGMDDIGGLQPIEKTATVADLISARSGVYHPASNEGDLLAFAPPRGSKTPGTYWLYSNWDFNAAGAAFEKMTGKDIFDALRDDIAIPIGMQDFDRKRQQKLGDLKRSQYPAYHMWLSTRDMVRIAYLMLHNGKWKDRQIVPADWVAKSTSPITPVTDLNPPTERKGPWGYGYLWWVWDGPFNTGAFQGAYTSRGAFGQYMTVLPALDMAVAHKCAPVNQFVNDFDYVQLLHRIAGDDPASEKVLPVLETQGQQAAVNAYEQLKANPGNVLIDESDLWAAGVSLTKHHHYREAEHALQLNLVLYPKSVRSLRALGQAEAAAGQKNEAIATFNDVLKVRKDDPWTREGLAELGQPLDGHTWVTLNRSQLGPFTGTYTAKDEKFVVERSGGRLFIREYDNFGEMQDRYTAFPYSANAFLDALDGSWITFDGKTITRKTNDGQSASGTR